MMVAERISLPDQRGLGDPTYCEAEDPAETAQAVGLLYVTDKSAGIQRKRAGRHFSYIGLDGKPIRDTKELQRIKALGIPPAWKNVWICPTPRGHIQATGRDAKGRKQYRYHTRWREVRDASKYDRIIAFGEAMPSIREQSARHLALPGLPYEKVIATVISLLDSTLIRVGNEEYMRENNTFGLTTMPSDAVDVAGSRVRFHFRGKGGKEHDIDVKDRQLAKIVKRCQELPGYELFQYVDEHDQLRAVTSSDVNDYLHQITGQHFTAKDFRTWGGTVVATSVLQELGPFSSQTQAKSNISQAVKAAAAELGNTPAICRKCYIHPAIVDAYMDGSLLDFLAQHAKQAARSESNGLRPDEALVLAFFHQSSHNQQQRQ